jgi:hypothetical protein
MRLPLTGDIQANAFLGQSIYMHWGILNVNGTNFYNFEVPVANVEVRLKI